MTFSLLDIALTFTTAACVGQWFGTRRGISIGLDYSVHATWLRVQQRMSPEAAEQFRQAMLAKDEP